MPQLSALKTISVSLALCAFATASAVACPEGDPNSTNYIRRDGERCEGIRRQLITGSLSLISFASRGGNGYGSRLLVRVPNVEGMPRVRLQSLRDRYHIDDFELLRNGSHYEYSLPTDNLQRAGVELEDLQALAVVPGSQPRYVPVIIDRPTSSYEFVLYAVDRSAFPVVRIIHNDETVYDYSFNTSRNIAKFVWTPSGSDTAGLYFLHVEAQTDRGRDVTYRIPFRHDPDWLQ